VKAKSKEPSATTVQQQPQGMPMQNQFGPQGGNFPPNQNIPFNPNFNAPFPNNPNSSN
jgi:hypothetical protein